MKLAATVCVLTAGVLLAQSYSRETISLNFFSAKTVSYQSPKLSGNETSNPTTDQQNNLKDDFERQLQRLRSFREKGTLKELLNEGKLIERQWGESGGESYGKLILEFLGILTHSRYISDEVIDMSQNYVVQTLKKADTFGLTTEWKLLWFLRYPFSEKDKIELQQRREGTKLWLHLLRRLEVEKDENFDPDDLPSLNVVPPAGVRVRFAGMSPEAIKDPKLRAEYEAAIVANAKKLEYHNQQSDLRRDEESILRNAIDYIANAYSVPPKNFEEFQEILNNSKVSNDLKKEIETKIQLLTAELGSSS
ncbi:MAG: hypothetical protein WBD22_02930 [Pyrinomonadaceae bacterium]